MSENKIYNSETIKTELERLHPKEGDIFILNIDTNDPDVIYSEDIAESVEQLSDVLKDLTGLTIPILVFGNDLDISLLKKEEIRSILENIDNLEDIMYDSEDEDDEELDVDSENLADIFN